MRLTRLAAAATVLAVTWFAGVPAIAHDSAIVFAVAGDGAGKVRVAALWAEDRHPVDQPVSVVLTAIGTPSLGSAAAQRVGPYRMTAVTGHMGVYESVTSLPPGRWKATAESAIPVIGRGTAELTVGTTSHGFPADFPPLPPEPAWWAFPKPPNWLVVPALVGAVLAVALHQRRRSRAR